MAANVKIFSTPFISFLLLQFFYPSNSQPYIGVNYGNEASELPSPQDTVNLLKTTTIGKVRLLGSVDRSMLKALENSGIEVVIGLDNTEIQWAATGPGEASQWVNSNVMPYYPASKIIIIAVGDEVLASENPNVISALLPAMQNIQNALNTASFGEQIKVTTVHSMGLLSEYSPPSSGAFNSSFDDTMKELLRFQSEHGSPFMINAFPYYAYISDPKPETLAFCLFQPNSGQVNSKNNIKYMNMFDVQVDAVRTALDAMGYKDMEIVVAETGWARQHSRDEVGPSLENAQDYNGNLLNHLRSGVGTPLMPGKTIDTYIYELYDEDEKVGTSSISAQSFGLFKSDTAQLYDVGLFKSSQNEVSSSTTPTPNPTLRSTGLWCVPKPAGVSSAQLQKIIDSTCNNNGIDCSPIKAGGACFEPNAIESHAAYVMNLYYQSNGRNPWDCDFGHMATLITTDPSYDGCVYSSASM